MQECGLNCILTIHDAHNNLGWYYQSSGQFEEALKEYKAAVRINRNMALTYGGILWIYLEN